MGRHGVTYMTFILLIPLWIYFKNRVSDSRKHTAADTLPLLLVSVLSADSAEITLTRQVLQKKGIIVLTGSSGNGLLCFRGAAWALHMWSENIWLKEAEGPVGTKKCRNLKNPIQKETPARQDKLLGVNEGEISLCFNVSRHTCTSAFIELVDQWSDPPQCRGRNPLLFFTFPGTIFTQEFVL